MVKGFMSKKRIVKTSRTRARYILSNLKRLGNSLLRTRVARYIISLRHRKHAPKFAVGLAVVVIVFGLFRFGAMAAPDLLDDWTFTTPSEYSYSDGIEVSGGLARLKAQNYTDDPNTSALYHFDESGGVTASDSSSNDNDATIAGGSFATGNLNNAVDLDGVDDGITAGSSPSLQLGQQHSLEAWTKFDDPFDSTTQDRRNAVIDKGDYQLYFDNETGKLTYEVANANATAWSQAAGANINGSWGTNGKRSVTSSTVIGSSVYAGLGNQLGDAEVWRWNGGSWAMIGGDGVNNSWDDQTFEDVYSLTTDGTNLYAGLGTGAGDAEVWMWNGTTWTKIGGDAINASWQVSTFEVVGSLEFFGSNLYAGLGTGAGDAEVWMWNGTTWTKIGGDSLNGGWTTNFETVRSLRHISGTLYAGLGDTAGDADFWAWNGASWTQIGGDGINSSWPAATYEGVYSIGTDGTDIYAGLGTGSGDGEVWRYDGGSWTKVGGDGDNGSWPSASGDVVFTLPNNGSTVYAGIYDTAGGGYMYSWDGTSWTALGGQYINNSWGYWGQGSVEVMQVSGEHLYAGLGSAAGSAQVWRSDGASWSLVGGQGVNNSWAANTYEQISSMSSHEGNLYVGLGTTANDAEVWMWDGATWSQIGGDSLNGGWTTNFEEVNALASFQGDLYAGLGNSNGDAEVWRWDGAAWEKIGGDGLNTSWVSNYDRVSALTTYKGSLIAGLGAGVGEAELWRLNGANWEKIGGDALNNSWDGTFEQVEGLIQMNNRLYVGLGNTAGDGEVWELDDTTWTKIGGDAVNSSWADGTYERVRTMAVYNGDLYAGLGSSTGEGEVWKYSDGNWVKLGGNSVNGSWASTMEEVESFSAFRGKLYAGTGNTANADATVWAIGDNGYLQSDASSFDTAWRHVAATYDGLTMRLYIDGSLESSLAKSITVPSSNRDLLIGMGYGGREYGKPQSRFQGLIDEVRLSSVARSSFTSTPYTSQPQTISPTTSVRKNGVWHWDTLSQTQTPDGGTIAYRLSNNEGASWLYWNGTDWSESTSTSMANTPQVVAENFEEFPVTFGGMLWQAIFSSDGTERTSLDGVSAEATSDTNDPSSNAESITGYKANGGGALTDGGWTNGSSPHFTWDAATDNDAGIYGYCAYLGTDASADPVTAKGLLGNSPKLTGNHCDFIVPSAEIDLATPGYLESALVTSNDPYYLTLRAIDKAGNVFNSSTQFSFRFDNTAPSNPGFITAPSGFINTKSVEMSWPDSGVSAPQDSNSGVAGLQYRIGAGGQWYGDSHSGTGDMSDLLANDGVYATQETPDFDNLIDGINIVYFRTWDNAGNYTTAYATATLKINTNGSPSEPTSLVALPPTNTTNSFGFNWDAPVTYVGNVSSIVYCYSINTVPSPATCNYTAAGSTELTVGPYATQPGSNTLYVAARDESGNINYSSFASTTFTANTTAPGIPLNSDIVDVSIKNTSNWRLALTWDQPLSGAVSSYRVYRSTNGTDFSMVGTSSSTTYIDAGLSQQTYYYRVAACDNTNNCGAFGSTVQESPTGKFTSPASIVSGPTVSEVTTKHAAINWSTDRPSDSKVSIGTQSGSYAASEIGNSNQVSAHTIALDNLSPGTTYYYKVKWTDEDGNTGTSQEATFTTSPAPVTKEVSVYDISLSGASVSFTTRGSTKAKIYYGISESFGGLKEINTSEAESLYDVQLAELLDGTKYYYMISTVDKEGTEYRGQISSFTTPERPRIINLRFQPIEGEPTSTQQVTWNTNVPSTSSVSYTLLNEAPVEVYDAKLATEHSITIRNLRDDSQYSLVAQSRDAAGNLAVSDRQSFRTALDTRPPKISNITVESSIRGSGSEARGQIVVSWQTDEPSTSQIAYTEGSDAKTFNSKTAEDTRLTTEHIVIISDLPTSRVYSIQPVSSDGAQNQGAGETQTAIIGRSSDSALTIVFNALRAIFGL